ncbi:MAG: protein phosphatase 2C domain-containing protein [Anaerolineales bacterium]
MTSPDPAHVGIAALSHPGETGKNNEDRYSVTSYRLGSRRTPAVLAVVADGIGGHLAGEVASQLAVEAIVRQLGRAHGRAPLRELRSAVIEAARAVSRASQEADERRGMGSTVAVAWVVDDQLFTAFVGDSRIYVMRGGVIHQTSVDHTWIQEALDHRVISAEEAHDHPNAHVLRRHLGGAQVPEPDLRLRLSSEEGDARARANQGLRLRSGDQILLCSDGLTDLVSQSEIRDSLVGLPPDEAADRLVELARARGGHDNITVVILTVPPPGPGQARRRLARFVVASAIGSLALLALLAIALAAGWWFGLWPWSGSPIDFGDGPRAPAAVTLAAASFDPAAYPGWPFESDPLS